MPNFLSETRTALNFAGRHTSDIAFIGSSDGYYRMAWWQFARLADRDYSYASGPQPALDLYVEFDDGAHMVRGDVGGWDYYPGKSVHAGKLPEGLFAEYGSTLADINMGEE